MRIAWSKPPPLIMCAGNNHFLRQRALRFHIGKAHSAGYDIRFVVSDAEVDEAISISETWGTPTLLVADPNVVDFETAKTYQEAPVPKTSILFNVSGPPNEKKMPVVGLVHGAHQQVFNLPPKKKDLRDLAIRFARAEASRLLGSKDVLDRKLAGSLVRAVGTDLGSMSFEIEKAAALCRYESRTKITADDLKKTIHPSAQVDLQPLREALADADGVRTAAALTKIKRRSTSDPTMMLLRARGGPADLVYRWLQTALLLSDGIPVAGIATSLGSPEWAITREIAAAKKWGREDLTRLLSDLAHVDRGVFKGIPAPWTACEAALLRGCHSVSLRYRTP